MVDQGFEFMSSSKVLCNRFNKDLCNNFCNLGVGAPELLFDGVQ